MNLLTKQWLGATNAHYGNRSKLELLIEAFGNLRGPVIELYQRRFFSILK